MKIFSDVNICEKVRMQTSSSAQQQSRVTNGGRTATNNYSMNKSASASSMKNSADDVLKDLEDGLKKSTNYIEELQGRYQVNTESVNKSQTLFIFLRLRVLREVRSGERCAAEETRGLGTTAWSMRCST